MATRIASTRFLCPLFQPALTLRCNAVNIKRYVRRRRCVTGLISVKEPIDDSKQVHSQTDEQPSQDNVFRNCEKSNIQQDDRKSRDSSESVQFSQLPRESRYVAAQTTALPRFGEVDGLLYEKVQPGDKCITRLVSLARSKKLREQQGKVILEGKHLIGSALDAGASVQKLYFSSVSVLRELPLDKLRRASVVKVRMEDTKVCSDLDTSQDVIAIFKRPEASHLTFSEEKYGRPVPLTLICDNVRDPGNLGAVLRSAAAAGCHSVLLTKGCVDVWGPKVLRAAMGAHFRLPIIPGLTWSQIPNHLPKTATVHTADNCSMTMTEQNYNTGHRYPSDDVLCESKDYDDSSKSLQAQYYYTDWVAKHTGIVIGGETHGLSRDALRLAERTGGRRLLIPMVDGVDSLNSAMAASVLLFEGRKQLLALAQKNRL